MTVKEVFELRKQGKIEEAYEAIRPMYAVHKGKYTTLCMFWTANDILKKRIGESRFEEAEKIFKALLRVLPNIEDKDGKALSSILYEAVALDKEYGPFRILDFVAQLKVEQLSEEDWKPYFAPAIAGKPSHSIPPVAQRILSRAFMEIEEESTPDNALKVMPLLQEAMRRNPHDKQNLSYIELVYRIMGEPERAEMFHKNGFIPRN